MKNEEINNNNEKNDNNSINNNEPINNQDIKEVKSNSTVKEKKRGNVVFNIISRILIVAILICVAIFVLKISKYYVDDDIKDKTNLIINNNNVTARLKEELIIKDDVIYLSMKDIKNFLDNHVYEEKETNQVITTSDKNIAVLNFKNNTMIVNGSNIETKANAIEKDDVIYLPISELEDIYDVEIKYIENTDIVTIDSLDRKQEKATTVKKISVKSYAKILSRTVDKVKKEDSVIIIKEVKNGWTKVRTENGKIGYVKTNKLTDCTTVREDITKTPQINGKINMFWDYYSEVAQAPDRTGESYQGVNVVSPTFFYINTKGEFVDHVGTAGENYIKWAKGNGYKVWAMFSNSEAKSIKITSEILNSYTKRQELIENVIEVCQKYNLDGINLDFEWIYEKDKDVFSRLVIELAPRMKAIGAVLSVDLTAPDGSPNWSLCYDRYVLGKVADYLVFMGYDQYGTSSTSAGTTAGYDWVELAINKFLTTYEVDSEKLILAIPFYTRIWTETSDGSLSSKAISMNAIEKNIPNGTEKTWLDDVKQYYVEFKSGSTTRKIWIEDETSIEAKVSLVEKYNLAGVSAWEKDKETNNIWSVIKQGLEKAEKNADITNVQ